MVHWDVDDASYHLLDVQNGRRLLDIQIQGGRFAADAQITSHGAKVTKANLALG